MTLHVRIILILQKTYPIILIIFTFQTTVLLLLGNAVWEDAESASRALHGLTTQPIALRSKFTEDVPQPMETSDPSPLSLSLSTGSDDNPTCTTPAELPEVKVQWYVGVSHPKAKQLLLRYAVEGDIKTSGAAQRSNYYRKYGNPNKRVGMGGGRSSGSVSDGGSGGKTWRNKTTDKDLRYVRKVV